MIKLIAHRGNIDGPNSLNENSPDILSGVMNDGYDAEIDLRIVSGELMLGHDGPEHLIHVNFLKTFAEKLWIHCKNYEALYFLASNKEINFNFFYHSNDEYVMTSRGYIFTRPGGLVGPSSVMVMPEITDCYTERDIKGCYAVCSDYVGNVEKLISLLT